MLDEQTFLAMLSVPLGQAQSRPRAHHQASKWIDSWNPFKMYPIEFENEKRAEKINFSSADSTVLWLPNAGERHYVRTGNGQSKKEEEEEGSSCEGRGFI